tara:strand:+ start:285 stop:452 length:168 start_codon:yes stop_codon:yes gene_type:complete
MNAILSNPYARKAAVLGALWALQHYVKDQRVKAACYGAAGVIVLRSIPVAKDAFA